MRKKCLVLLAVLTVIALCVCVWFYGYCSRKSNDNLPELATIAEMSEADVNSLLPGYKNSQLKEVWGEPNRSKDNTSYWEIGDKTLIVNYNNKGIVVVCGLKDEAGESVVE